MASRFTTAALWQIRADFRSQCPATTVFACIFALVFATATTLGQQPAEHQPSPTPSAQQIPDAPSATKQSGSLGHKTATVVKTIGQDEWHLISAPFRIDSVGFSDKTPFVNKTLFWDSVVVGATGVLIANDESVAQQVPYSWHQTSVDISNACTYTTAAAAGGIFLTGLFTGDEHAKRTGVLAAEASIDSFLIYGSMKLIFNRDRPYTSPHEGQFFAGNFSGGSFPSGHSALAFTLASVVAHEYPSLPVQLAMYGLATTVATTRVTGGQHFPSDVFVGSTLGYLVGRYVANKDKHAQDQPAHSGKSIKRVPNAILQHVAVQ
jgi:membrane-associated phospholipid phosphatase